ncbi:MAG: cation:proton antiporter [Proteobacteria bacterium]|nr:cation:proton antiporter [Pseudomonadota bacterium]
MHDLIRDIALCILMAWLFGVAANLSRQPLILAYLVAGFVLGPSGLQWVTSAQSIASISELGLIFLLFMIGLEIDLKKIIGAGHVIVLTAASQILFGWLLAFAFFFSMRPLIGGDAIAWIYLAVAAVLSSTVIIVKTLYEKRELDTLPGRITLGVLVLQDVFAILFLAIQPSLDDLRPLLVAISIGQAAALVAAALLVSRFILPWLFHQIARLPELVLVGAIAWCFAVGELAVHLNLSREMGALVAGVALSTFPYALDVTAKVTGLRDFFVTLFFVGLGLVMPLPNLAVMTIGLIVAAFAVASRVATVFVPLYAMRQGIRASLLPALNLAQLSEFSLVVMQLGVAAGQVDARSANAVSVAFVLLAVVSTYCITRSEGVTRSLVTVLKRMGVRDLDHGHVPPAPAQEGAASTSPIVFLGFYRVASSILAELERQKTTLIDQICVIDFNPQVHKALSLRGVNVRYGDVSHPEMLAHAGLGKANIVVSSVPDWLLAGTSNEKLVKDVRALNAAAMIIATADEFHKVTRLYAAGADYVVVARIDEADDFLDAISAAQAGLLADKRAQVEARLVARDEVLP